MKRLRVSLTLIFLLVAGGCGGHGVDDAQRALWPDLYIPYMQITRAWTRNAELTDGIDVLVKASATLKSKSWREAYVKRYAELYDLRADERKKLISDQNRAHAEYIDVVLALSAARSELADLDFRDPLWRVFATRNGKRIYLSEIRPMEREDWPPQKLKAFFHYYKRWRRFYSLRFPRVGEGPIELTATGPAGTMRFTWPGVDGESM